MRRIGLFACALFLVCASGARTAAAPVSTQAVLTHLFTASRIEPDWFSQSFLQQVSVAQVESIVGQLSAQLGHFKSVKPEGQKYRVLFERGDDLATIRLDESGRIIGLFFEAPLQYASSFQSAVDAFLGLPGRTSLYVERGGTERASVASDLPLAVGSTFKLAVLNALVRQIDRGSTSWVSVVRLSTRDKSLPSGILQTWPDDSPMTVYALAALMISQSDNTAADTLLLYAGRSNVEAFGPRNRPLLTTREAFILKDPENAELLARYRAGGETQRRALLGEVDALPLPDVSIFTDQPLDTDIEWFFTTHELCELMVSVQGLALMGINPGLADAADWRSVAYKGGSEPGVLNLTTWLVAKDGTSHCVSATWNDDKALDELKFYGLYKSLLSTLAR